MPPIKTLPDITKEGILGASAGPLLDAWIATHLFHKRIYAMNWPCGFPPDGSAMEAALDFNDPCQWHTKEHPVCADEDDVALILKPVEPYSTDFTTFHIALESTKQWKFSQRFSFICNIKSLIKHNGYYVDPEWWIFFLTPEIGCKAILLTLQQHNYDTQNKTS